MKNSELVELFKSLTVKELKRLTAFMDSPYADRGRYRNEVQILFKMLQKHAGVGAETGLNKENLYKQVFPGKAPVAGHLERVMFELNQVIRQFLVIEKYIDEKNTLAVQLDFSAILQSKGLSTKAEQVLHQAITDIEKIPVKSADHYAKAFEASSMAYSMASQKNRWKDDLQITNTLQYLDLYYCASRLHLVNHFLLLNSFSKVESLSASAPLNTVITLPEITPDEAPSIFIAHKIYLLLSNKHPTKEGFEELMHLLTAYEAQMDEDTTKLYFSYLRNYCTHLYMHGHFELLHILHQIQLDNLAKGYFLYQSKMPLGAYLSITTTALKAQKEAWAYAFIQQYKNQLVDPKNAEEVYNLNMANYYFHLREFDQALQFLPPASDDLDRHLTGRRLELKIYYETNSELLPYKLDAFKMYISRASKKQISESTRERHANFANLLLQLSQTLRTDQERVKRILGRIEEKQQLAEKEWLIEQVKKMHKK